MWPIDFVENDTFFSDFILKKKTFGVDGIFLISLSSKIKIKMIFSVLFKFYWLTVKADSIMDGRTSSKTSPIQFYKKKIKRVNREKTQRIQERLWVNPGFFLDEQGWLEFITATCSSHWQIRFYSWSSSFQIRYEAQRDCKDKDVFQIFRSFSVGVGRAKTHRKRSIHDTLVPATI